MIAMLTVLLYLGELLFWNPGLQYRQDTSQNPSSGLSQAL
uniref:Leukocyte immunoglobulin-like receptor, subfamily B, member 4B n=1 Tax=Mus musculus TaxID=10090 RepID=A0A1W2P783_MOUSE